MTRLTEDARAAFPAGELAAIADGGGWKVLAVEPPPGGYAAFEPVAALPWATRIARAWPPPRR